MLYRAGVERIANFVYQSLALLTVVPQHSDFDQFMTFEIAIDFPHDGRRESGVADHDYRLQVVGAGTQCASLRR